ncbi:unnamed protein product [Cyprideis torosa]|uniref:Uncharacterized protein n=1 Tax=Cyprideis torosa TaxID=163714 RepID=A0A7R8WRV0_9CRUS|nr:unnamed protein product [Cyprideis torosa]CAG0907220.1 unnamed protein product [Cyprideis torosa]
MVIGNDLLIRTFLFVNSFASFNLRYKYWKDGQIQETEQFPPHLQRYITQGNKMLKDLKALLNASDWQFTQDSKGVLIKEWYHPKLQSKIFYAEVST